MYFSTDEWAWLNLVLKCLPQAQVLSACSSGSCYWEVCETQEVATLVACLSLLLCL